MAWGGQVAAGAGRTRWWELGGRNSCTGPSVWS